MRITEGMLQNIVDRSEINTSIIDNRCLVMVLGLKNGYMLIAHHQEYDKSSFNEEVAFSNCLNEIKSKILSLETYMAYDRLTYGYDIENEYE